MKSDIFDNLWLKNAKKNDIKRGITLITVPRHQILSEYRSSYKQHDSSSYYIALDIECQSWTNEKKRHSMAKTPTSFHGSSQNLHRR